MVRVAFLLQTDQSVMLPDSEINEYKDSFIACLNYVYSLGNSKSGYFSLGSFSNEEERIMDYISTYSISEHFPNIDTNLFIVWDHSPIILNDTITNNCMLTSWVFQMIFSANNAGNDKYLIFMPYVDRITEKNLTNKVAEMTHIPDHSVAGITIDLTFIVFPLIKSCNENDWNSFGPNNLGVVTWGFYNNAKLRIPICLPLDYIIFHELIQVYEIFYHEKFSDDFVVQNDNNYRYLAGLPGKLFGHNQVGAYVGDASNVCSEEFVPPKKAETDKRRCPCSVSFCFCRQYFFVK